MPQVMQNSCAHYWLYTRPLLYAGDWERRRPCRRKAAYYAPCPRSCRIIAHIIGVMRGRCSTPAGTPALPVPAGEKYRMFIKPIICATVLRGMGMGHNPLLYAGRDAGAPSPCRRKVSDVYKANNVRNCSAWHGHGASSAALRRQGRRRSQSPPA